MITSAFWIWLWLALFAPVHAQGISNSPPPIDTTQFDPAGAASSALSAATAAAPGLAPVQKVNSQIGSVVVPTYQRQVSSPTDITSGTMTWTFPVVFTNTPTCFPSIVATNANYVFAVPTTTAISTSSVTVSARASNTSLLSLGVVWALPPAGTTLVLSCIAPLP